MSSIQAAARRKDLPRLQRRRPQTVRNDRIDVDQIAGITVAPPNLTYPPARRVGEPRTSTSHGGKPSGLQRRGAQQPSHVRTSQSSLQSRRPKQGSQIDVSPRPALIGPSPGVSLLLRTHYPCGYGRVEDKVLRLPPSCSAIPNGIGGFGCPQGDSSATHLPKSKSIKSERCAEPSHKAARPTTSVPAQPMRVAQPAATACRDGPKIIPSGPSRMNSKAILNGGRKELPRVARESDGISSIYQAHSPFSSEAAQSRPRAPPLLKKPSTKQLTAPRKPSNELVPPLGVASPSRLRKMSQGRKYEHAITIPITSTRIQDKTKIKFHVLSWIWFKKFIIIVL